ncbi:MAG TPA: CHAT domain-containing tetratricopeptide repeat protein, partial [Ktedonobacteraceae bacterium]
MQGLPSWLVVVEGELARLRESGRPYVTAAARIELLLNALARAEQEGGCTGEMVANLQHALAIAYLEHLSASRTQQMEDALLACEEALQVYTLAHYPYQYASVQITLGSACRERTVGTKRDSLERAIACYQEALRVFTREDFPKEYAGAQHGLGQTYQLRIEGEKNANIEQAIACCHEALSVRTLIDLPFEHAQTLQVLGTAYFMRVAGERRDNLERAIDFSRRAAVIFTLDVFPVEYAQGQIYLANAYSQRISGEQRDNLEQAITYYHQALQVYTLETFPIENAKAQNNLGIAYFRRVAGERRDNLEQAITCYREVLRVWTLETSPYQYALLQNNRGAAYVFRVAGKKRDNLEQAIACYREVLRVWTLEALPYQYAKIQNNLGEAYQHRLAGEREDNLDQAIACYHETIRIWTLEALPQDYAMAQLNLGVAYQLRSGGDRQEDLERAIRAHQEALGVYTLNAYPNEHRQVQLDCAETQALGGDWAAAHEAYVAARKAEDLLVALGAGAVGRDAILKEGREASTRDGYVLAQMGKIEEAAVAIEAGRARGLAEAIQFNAADPTRISDAERQARYVATHGLFSAAQTALQTSLPGGLDERGQRQIMLERTADYRRAKAAFDAAVEEIHVAQDPADFFIDILDAAKILAAAELCGQGHSLVYLAATPWGGVAVAALAAAYPIATKPKQRTPSRFAMLPLSALTSEFVGTLIETRLDDNVERITGGFDCAQRGIAFELLQDWPGNTFREQAEALHLACTTIGHAGTLDAAAQFVLSIPQLASFVDALYIALSVTQRSVLMETLNNAVLQRELQRCQALLREKVLEPMHVWLQEAGVTSLTIVPCGPLAAFPLAGVLLSSGRTLGETLPTSLAPSARSLLGDERGLSQRRGIYSLGNPYPTQQELRWGEAEAFTLAALGAQLGQPTGVSVQWQATREGLIEALHTGYVVDASCHGAFDTRDFLRSRLMLANEEELTLADMLSYQADLRGLRLLMLSACQTAMLDLQGARDEVRSLAAGMLQAGAAAVLAALWAVDDRATYLLMVRFAQEWFPAINDEAPAAALGRAQRWLRTVTNGELQVWQSELPCIEPLVKEQREDVLEAGQLVAVRGRGNRFDA